MGNGSQWTGLPACRGAMWLLCALAAIVLTPAVRGVDPPADTGQPVLVANASAGAVSRPRLVTNIWIDTDIRQVLLDISSQTDTMILCDASVQALVSMSVKDMPLEECLERVCAVGGFNFVKIKDYYVVAKADPSAPLFQQMAEPYRVTTSYATVDQVRSLLHSSLQGYVTCDKSSGALVITAPESIRNRILDTIKIVDQPSPQVAIEAIVFELTEAGSKQLGLDWQFEKNHVALGGNNLIGTFTYDAASDVGTFVDVTLRAIVETGKGQVLANPRVFVMNNTQAEIFVGQEKYYSLLNGQASNPYYTLQPIKAGVTLKVLPNVGKDGRIMLDLEPEVSDVKTDTSAASSTDNKGVYTAPMPVVTRRHARTVVHVEDGQTVVIGGLLMEQSRSLIDKVPAAGDIPVLGAPFRNVHTERLQTEVVILITAHTVDVSQADHETLAARLEHQYVTPLDALAAPAGGLLDSPCCGRKAGSTLFTDKHLAGLKRLCQWVTGEVPK